MKRHEREAVELMRAIVVPHGCTVATEQGGKHLAVVITTPAGQWHKFPISSSPRADTQCQQNNIRQQVTAWLEAAGIVSARGSTGTRKPKRHTRVRSRIWRIEVAVDADDGPSRDPWDALSGFRLNGPANRAG